MRETRSILGLGWAGVASSVFVENPSAVSGVQQDWCCGAGQGGEPGLLLKQQLFLAITNLRQIRTDTIKTKCCGLSYRLVTSTKGQAGRGGLALLALPTRSPFSALRPPGHTASPSLNSLVSFKWPKTELCTEYCTNTNTGPVSACIAHHLVYPK